MYDHKEDIVSTRKGCLGGSDAKLIATVAEQGAVPKTSSILKRLAVCNGLIEHRQFTNATMEFGNSIEAQIYDMLHSQDARWQSNPCLVSEKYSRPNVKVIDHVDFMLQDDENKTLYIGECKATQLTFEQTRGEYKYQLLHHYLLGKEFAEKLGGYKVIVQLCHYCTAGLDIEGGTGLEFDTSRLKVARLKGLETKARLYDIAAGVEIIDTFLATFSEYYDGDEIESTYLPENTKKQFDAITTALQIIEEKQNEVDAFKTKLFELMTAKNIRCIKDALGRWSISRVDASETKAFDAKKFWEDFKKDHPRKADKLAGQYTKTSKKKGYCLIKMNDKQTTK
jgi:hypothetical protein